MKIIKIGIKGAIIGGLVGFVYIFSLTLFQMTNFGREFLTGILGLFYKPITSFTNFWCNNFIFPKNVGGQYNCNIFTPEIILIIILIMIGFLIGIITSKKQAQNL
jgi:hypothetical protein